jgi:hypothetical protein
MARSFVRFWLLQLLHSARRLLIRSFSISSRVIAGNLGRRPGAIRSIYVNLLDADAIIASKPQPNPSFVTLLVRLPDEIRLCTDSRP